MNAPLVGAMQDADLHVMTFNIRRRIDLTPRPADRWPRRRGPLKSLLRSERPDVLGVQEALPDQSDWVLASLGAGYRFVGRGRRAGGRGEGCPLFYDASRLTLLDWSQQWLSDEPDVEGSTTWGNLVPRVRVRAEFRDAASGSQFAVVNTHLDAFSRRARIRSAAELRRIASRSALPTVVMGDLNADPASRTVAELFDGGVLRDTWSTAEERATAEWGTFGGYRQPRAGARRIDMIAVSAGVRVRRAGINARRFDGRWPSDHLPVQAMLRMPRAGERSEKAAGRPAGAAS